MKTSNCLIYRQEKTCIKERVEQELWIDSLFT